MKKLTNDFGNIIADNQNFKRRCKRPFTYARLSLLEKLAHQNRERIQKEQCMQKEAQLMAK